MTYCYTHKSKHHSALIREASSCSRWELTQRPTTQQCEGSESPTWGVFIKPLPSRLRDLCDRGERKLAIPRKQHLPDTAEQKPIFTETMATLTRLTRVHTRRNSSAEGEVESESYPNQEQFAADICWESEIHFFLQ